MPKLLNTKHFKLTNTELDDFSSDFTPDEEEFCEIQKLAEIELPYALDCEYEINGTHSGVHTNIRYFIQIKIKGNVYEWEYLSD